MGAQWKHAGRVANSNKRGAVIGKLVKEIIVAAKIGDPNPANNARLWTAVEAARKQSVPRDTIERAIKKGSGQLDEQVNFELVTYEGFAPSNVPIIVECLTENKNRTAADIRVLFRKGQLGSPGSVAWMFDRLGIVEATHADQSLDIETVAIEAGAQNVEKMEGGDVPQGQLGARFTCDPKDLDSVSKFLTDSKWALIASEIGYMAKNYVEISDEQKKDVVDFLNSVDENDDVHRVYAGLR